MAVAVEKRKLRLKGLFEENPTPFAEAKAHNTAVQERIIAFNKKIQGLIDTKNLDGLKKLAFNELQPEFMDKTELMKVFTAFRSVGAPDQMQRLYKECQNDEFTNAPMVREFLAVSYNKSKQPDEAIRIAEKLLTDAKDPKCPNREYIDTSEVYAAIAKAYVIKGDRPKAREYYEKGLFENHDFYPGINAAYESLAAGDVEKARDLATLTYQICQRDGGLDTNNYWCTTTMLESACLMGQDENHIHQCLDALLSYPKIGDFEKTSTIDALKSRVIPALEKLEKQGNTEMPAVLKNVRKVVDALEHYDPKDVKKSDRKLSAQELVIKNSYSSRGMSGWETEVIGGNAKFGGAVANIVISRFDRVEFKKLLHIPLTDLVAMVGGDIRKLPAYVRKNELSLSEITNTDDFIKASQVLVRENYGNSKKRMEEIDSQGHYVNHDLPTKANYSLTGVPNPNLFNEPEEFWKLKDNEVPTDVLERRVKRRELQDKRKDADINTNAIIEFIKGLGDCRHHGQAGMQVLFNLWQREQTDQCHNQAIAALKDGNREDFTQALQKADEILADELRVFDVDVSGPIAMKKKYEPVRPELPARHFIPDSKSNPIEEHTMTFLVHKDDNGKLDRLRFADAFYQNTYQWGDGDVNLESLGISAAGRVLIPGGLLKNVGPNNDAVPVMLEAAPYAGNRTSAMRGDIGNVPYEHGIPIEGFDLKRFLEKRPDIETQIKQITQGHLDDETQEIIKQGAASHRFKFNQDTLVAVLSEHKGVELLSYGRPCDGFELVGMVPHWTSGYGGKFEMVHSNVPEGTMIAVGDLENLRIDDFDTLKSQLQAIDIYPTGHDGNFSNKAVADLQQWFFDRRVRDDAVNDQSKIAHATKLTKEGLGADRYDQLVDYLADEMNMFKYKDQDNKDKLLLIPEDRAERVEIVKNILDGLSKSVRYTRKDGPATAHQIRSELKAETNNGGEISLNLQDVNKIIVLRKTKKEVLDPDTGQKKTIEEVLMTPLDISMIGKTYVTADGEPLGDRGVVDLATIVQRAVQIEDQKAREALITDTTGLTKKSIVSPPLPELKKGAS